MLDDSDDDQTLKTATKKEPVKVKIEESVPDQLAHIKAPIRIKVEEAALELSAIASLPTPQSSSTPDEYDFSARETIIIDLDDEDYDGENERNLEETQRTQELQTGETRRASVPPQNLTQNQAASSANNMCGMPPTEEQHWSSRIKLPLQTTVCTDLLLFAESNAKPDLPPRDPTSFVAVDPDP